MARKKISEFRAKHLIHQALDVPYAGLSFGSSSENMQLDQATIYVVKVDEGVKKRMKKGLVGLKRSAEEVNEDIEKFRREGYSHFIVEPFVPHEQSSEKYLSIERLRDGLQVLYSEKGGIDVEENDGAIRKMVIPADAGIQEIPNQVRDDSIKEIASSFGLKEDVFLTLLKVFNTYYFSFLEINPLVVENDRFYFLDIAAEVDSAGEFFVHNAWTEYDFRTGEIKVKTDEEKNVEELSHKSQASFNLTVINPEGSVFMLLSGGGASIVLADEVYNLGFGKEIANYGEYSGNPNAEEVYVYTKNLLSLLLKSPSPKKILIVGGGVANFTNISSTFRGVIRALDEEKENLQKQSIKVFVRRGGPNQKEGLAMMEKFLKKNNLYGLVTDPKTSLPEIVKQAVERL